MTLVLIHVQFWIQVPMTDPKSTLDSVLEEVIKVVKINIM